MYKLFINRRKALNLKLQFNKNKIRIYKLLFVIRTDIKKTENEI